MPRPPDKHLQLLLLFVVGFNVIPHTFRLPPWLTATAVLFLLWTALHIFKNVALPPTWLRALLVLAGSGGVLFQWQTILDQEPATALLVYLASLKMLEATRYRDAMLIIFTSYFLLMAHLLVSQSLPSTLFMGLDVLLITSLMFQLHKRDRRTSARSFRPAMRLLAVSLPVWIFLFIAFPRFSAGFWRLNAPSAAMTGFSDDMSPGAVERLIGSEDPAFRVTFTRGEPPSPMDMYWRGAILHLSEGGLKWSREGGGPRPEITKKNTQSSGRAVVQEIVLEPSYKKWLFALDVPRTVEFDDPVKNSQVRTRAGAVFETRKDVGTRVLYQAFSAVEHPRQELPPDALHSYLQVPANIEAEAVALARKLEAETDGTTLARVNRVLKFFDDENFRYTREPGALRSAQQLSEFLLKTKVGFCEHFAASFTSLMRLMKVPARVVVGFQGGVYNGFGRYVIVRSLDAHAWAEVWHEEKSRWERVDPTATIAPLRLRVGGDYNLIELSELQSGLSEEMIRNGMGRGWATRWTWRARMAWDAAASQWNNFLLKYDFQYQQELLAKLGLRGANRWIFFVWVAVGLLLFVIGLQVVLRMQAKKQDPLLDGYHRFCAKLESADLARGPNEGPLQFARRISLARPDLAREIEDIAGEFIRLRYGPAGEDAEVLKRAKAFRKRTIAFKLKPEERQSAQ